VTLPASGAISLNAINTELGATATGLITLNDYNPRLLSNTAAGTQLSLSNFYSKTAKQLTAGFVSVTSGKTTTYSYGYGKTQFSPALGSYTGSTLLGGQIVYDVYCSSLSNSGSTFSYFLTVAGNQTSNVTIFTQCTINGTSYSRSQPGGAAPTYDSGNNVTIFNFDSVTSASFSSPQLFSNGSTYTVTWS
jgi:hypothetical protein